MFGTNVIIPWAFVVLKFRAFVTPSGVKGIFIYICGISWIISASLVNWSLKKGVTICICCFGFDVCPCSPSIKSFLLLSCLFLSFKAGNILLETSLIFSVNSSWPFNC